VLREPRLRGSSAARGESAVPDQGRQALPLQQQPAAAPGYPGTTGLKTGYTDAAGRCLVATARRRAVKLGRRLLDSANTGKQATQLLDRASRHSRRR
jgi:D-alanyl-D-alanine carboxypeptidase (penicillin-binding protein 5/6)